MSQQIFTIPKKQMADEIICHDIPVILHALGRKHCNLQWLEQIFLDRGESVEDVLSGTRMALRIGIVTRFEDELTLIEKPDEFTPRD